MNAKIEVTQALEARIAELEAKLATVLGKLEAKRDVGERKMTDADAQRILGGDLAQAKHKDAAQALGLSYGQVYSARLGFTFKHVAKALKDQGIHNKWL